MGSAACAARIYAGNFPQYVVKSWKLATNSDYPEEEWVPADVAADFGRLESGWLQRLSLTFAPAFLKSISAPPAPIRPTLLTFLLIVRFVK